MSTLEIQKESLQEKIKHIDDEKLLEKNFKHGERRNAGL